MNGVCNLISFGTLMIFKRSEIAWIIWLLPSLVRMKEKRPSYSFIIISATDAEQQQQERSCKVFLGSSEKKNQKHRQN